jgi:hypothetical protein
VQHNLIHWYKLCFCVCFCVYFLCKMWFNFYVLTDCHCCYIYRQDFATPAKNCRKLTFTIMLITINSLLYKWSDYHQELFYLGRQKGEFGCGAAVENAILVLQIECWYPPLPVVYHLENIWSLAFHIIHLAENRDAAILLIGIFSTSLGIFIYMQHFILKSAIQLFYV